MSEQRNIHANAVRVWRWTGAITSTLLLSGPLGTLVLLFVFDFPIWAILAPVPILIAISWTLTVWAPVARYRRFCYQVNADEVYIQHGIFVTKQSVVPMSKIQYVHSYQGPLLKAYGLKTVTISTGATSHEIPCLHEEEAEQPRTQLAVFARVVE